MSGESNQVVWRGVRPVEGIAGVWPARNAARVNKFLTIAIAGLFDIYTVPADKKLYISATSLVSSMTTANTGRVFLAVRNVANTRQYITLYHNFIAVDREVTDLPHMPALEADAGWDVYLDSNHGDIDAFGAFFGWLEDA